MFKPQFSGQRNFILQCCNWGSGTPCHKVCSYHFFGNFFLCFFKTASQ